VLAIVPVSAPIGAKRRLAHILSLDERAELVVTMLADVVAACQEATSIGRVLVVTPEPGIVPEGVDTLLDPGEGHAEAVELGLAHAPPEGALVVMADCPLARPETLDALVAAANPVAIGRAQDGGTNALALRPPGAVEPAFGLPDGARIVAERARQVGVEATIIDDPGLAFDVDTVDDLRRVLEIGAGTRTKIFIERAFAEFRLP
jgi:2-phospho-L-lactate/phosphoenolpyruvate guanylyltransferase